MMWGNSTSDQGEYQLLDDNNEEMLEFNDASCLSLDSAENEQTDKKGDPWLIGAGCMLLAAGAFICGKAL